MDADILIIGEVMSELLTAPDQCAGVFSGHPLSRETQEQILPKNFEAIRGRYHVTPDGRCLGCSYFAIYHSAILKETIQHTGIHFNKYLWQDIPVQVQDQIRKLGLQCKRYDTAKVLNLILLANGHSLLYKDVPGLFHIGGMSRYYLHNRFKHTIQLTVTQYIDRLLYALSEKQPLPEVPDIPDVDINQAVQKLTTAIIDVHEDFTQDVLFTLLRGNTVV
ncbi:hypothetical protein GF339_12765 [candidate division KSB3 bacterium]|uniref:Uncharacterized protein n=1 Tax=candidate division KSB3 bacterium TaxID=2044937 RepID=A0A9D5Q684_9BACT|nr:hypothetical protein [candidate division KSB3 bacterium]MBD3325455.1 hypothetical protein [candidate division KSB3 bacterium]